MDELPAWVTKKATNIASDARLAVLVGLIPLLGLVFILRLVQWYLLRKQFPALVTGESEFSGNYRAALPRLWFAVLLWPVAILAMFLYLVIAH
jgi:hypothetical protein